jgi:hypothetical protein
LGILVEQHAGGVLSKEELLGFLSRLGFHYSLLYGSLDCRGFLGGFASLSSNFLFLFVRFDSLSLAMINEL